MIEKHSVSASDAVSSFVLAQHIAQQFDAVVLWIKRKLLLRRHTFLVFLGHERIEGKPKICQTFPSASNSTAFSKHMSEGTCMLSQITPKYPSEVANPMTYVVIFLRQITDVVPHILCFCQSPCSNPLRPLRGTFLSGGLRVPRPVLSPCHCRKSHCYIGYIVFGIS